MRAQCVYWGLLYTIFPRWPMPRINLWSGAQKPVWLNAEANSFCKRLIATIYENTWQRIPTYRLIFCMLFYLFVTVIFFSSRMTSILCLHYEFIMNFIQVAVLFILTGTLALASVTCCRISFSNVNFQSFSLCLCPLDHWCNNTSPWMAEDLCDLGVRAPAWPPCRNPRAQSQPPPLGPRGNAPLDHELFLHDSYSSQACTFQFYFSTQLVRYFLLKEIIM